MVVVYVVIGLLVAIISVAVIAGVHTEGLKRDNDKLMAQIDSLRNQQIKVEESVFKAKCSVDYLDEQMILISNTLQEMKKMRTQRINRKVKL